MNKVHERLKAVKHNRNILAPSSRDNAWIYRLSPLEGDWGSSNSNEKLNEIVTSLELSQSIYPLRLLGMIGVQSFVRNFCNHPTSPKSKANFFVFPLRAQSTRTVLSHVASPAPVPFSHISALQIASVHPLQRAEMSL